MNPKHDQEPLIEFSEFIFNAISNQITQADTKAFGILTVIGIVTAALVDRLNSLRAMLGITHPLWIFVFSFSFVMVLLSTKAVLRVIYPRTHKKTGKSMMYFKDIASVSREEYVQRGESMKTEDVVRELYDNSYDLAQISNRKYNALRHAILLTAISLIWTICVLLLS